VFLLNKEHRNAEGRQRSSPSRKHFQSLNRKSPWTALLREEEVSIPASSELNAYEEGKETSVGAIHAHAEAQLQFTPPFKRARAIALARVLSVLLHVGNIDILELQLLRGYFDSLIQAREGFLRRGDR
jgi:hypothetical protein